MILAGVNDLLDSLKSFFPVTFLYFLPLLLILTTNPGVVAQEFAVYRMQQFELQSSLYGSRNSLINVEARSIDSKILTRRCVISKLYEITMEKIRDLLTQNAAGLLIVLPMSLFDMKESDKNHLISLEMELMREDIIIPIYFTESSPQIEQIYNDVKYSLNTDQSSSAAEAILNSATANGYQFVIAGQNSKAMNDYQLTNIYGKLLGNGVEEQLPTIAIIAHYDSMGIAPGLATGADSNASGVIALLEISRIFSKLYSSIRTQPKLNIQFLLSGAGKFSYQGTKRWIEEQLESGENTLLQDVSIVICLDSIGKGNSINFHVSKPPKENSVANSIFKLLEKISTKHNIKSNLIHKKINLADEFLAWEHERFSIKRISAVTISALESHKNPLRNSILDTKETVNIETLSKNILVISEIVARYAYGFTYENDTDIIEDSMNIDKKTVLSWLHFLTNSSRAAQIIHHKHYLINSLYSTLSKYLKDVKKNFIKADKRDPEFVFYDGLEYKLNVYSIKPAVFDLFLAFAITAYLGLLYIVLMHFNIVWNFTNFISSSTSRKKII